MQILTVNKEGNATLPHLNLNLSLSLNVNINRSTGRACRNLRSGRDCWWGEWLTSTLSTLNTTTEVSLSKALNPQLLPGCWSNGCPLLWVHVHYSLLCVCALGWVKCRAPILSMGHHTWQYITLLLFIIRLFLLLAHTDYGSFLICVDIHVCDVYIFTGKAIAWSSGGVGGGGGGGGVCVCVCLYICLSLWIRERQTELFLWIKPLFIIMTWQKASGTFQLYIIQYTT